jgi:hypothetical protein
MKSIDPAHHADQARSVKGHTAQVDICGCGQKVTLTLGALSLRLDWAVVEDVVTTLLRSLQLAAATGVGEARARLMRLGVDTPNAEPPPRHDGAKVSN